MGITISEQLRTFRGKLFRMDDHWRRLARSLEIVGTTPPDSLAELSFAAEQVAKHNFTLMQPGDDLGLVIAITPGSFATFARTANDGPATVIHSYPLPFARWAKSIQTGMSLRIAPQRQISPVSWPAELKCRSRMHYHLADRWAEAQEPGHVPCCSTNRDMSTKRARRTSQSSNKIVSFIRRGTKFCPELVCRSPKSWLPLVVMHVRNARSHLKSSCVPTKLSRQARRSVFSPSHELMAKILEQANRVRSSAKYQRHGRI